jgi:hypothetical protein
MRRHAARAGAQGAIMYQLATILPRMVAHQGVADGWLQTHPFGGYLVRRLVAIWHSRRPLSPATAAFIAAIQEQVLLRHLPHSLLGKVSNRIINEVRGINRIVYDISGKPPATIEWEWP